MTITRSGVVTVLCSLLVVASVATGGAGAQAGSDAASTDDVTLTITVVDQGGNPLGDVELSATWEGGGPRNATTAGNGKAFLDVPEGANVTITTDRRFYVRNEPYVVENATERDVRIDMARQGTATITVQDASGTGTVSDAFVRLFQNGQPVVSARTGPDGTFTTRDIEQDEYTLITYKEGYLRNKTTLTVDGTVQATRTIRQDSVLVTFRVEDDHFEPPRPVVDANVTIRGIADVTTQGNGQVTVSVPVNDEYDVEITKGGYGTDTKTLTVAESATSLNTTIQRVPSISASTGIDRVVVGENVSVRVTDEYGDRVVGATVSIDGTEVGQTDSEGVIEVPIESAGNHTIQVRNKQLRTKVRVEGVQPAPEETPTATAAATPTPEPTSGLGPGFGAGVVVLALLAVALLARRRT